MIVDFFEFITMAHVTTLGYLQLHTDPDVDVLSAEPGTQRHAGKNGLEPYVEEIVDKIREARIVTADADDDVSAGEGLGELEDGDDAIL